MNPPVSENPTTWQKIHDVLRPLHNALQEHLNAYEEKCSEEQKNKDQISIPKITAKEKELDAKASQEGGYRLVDLIEEDNRQEKRYLPEIETFISLLATTSDADFSWIEEIESLQGIEARINNALNFIDDAVHLEEIIGQPATDFATTTNLLLIEFWTRRGQINALWNFANFGKKIPKIPDYATSAEAGEINWWYMNRFLHALYITVENKNEKREEEEFTNKVENNVEYETYENEELDQLDYADAWKTGENHTEEESESDEENNDEDENNLKDPTSIRYTIPWMEKIIDPDPEDMVQIQGFYHNLKIELYTQPNIKQARKQWSTTLDTFCSNSIYRINLQINNASWVVECVANLPELLRPEFKQLPKKIFNILFEDHWKKETLPEFIRFMENVELEK